jgi:dsDNA-specific endonuclease/ATPase MutS2
MDIKIGDNVRFLREVGGGKVTGFRKGGFVLVEDKDGFEIPMLENDLVVIPSAKKYFSKEDEKNKQTKINPLIANKTSCNLENTEKICYVNFEERIVKLEQMVNKLTRRLEEIEAANSLRIHAKAAPLISPTEKHKKDDIIEIDLHAHSLLDCIDGLKASDIKEYQLKVFRDTMDRFKKDVGRQIIFIHGNGDGVLRQAILTELKYTYKHCQHQDASFQKYGFGATMVIIGKK